MRRAAKPSRDEMVFVRAGQEVDSPVGGIGTSVLGDEPAGEPRLSLPRRMTTHKVRQRVPPAINLIAHTETGQTKCGRGEKGGF